MSLELELHGSVESRPTFLSRGKIRLSCELDRNAVRYGEPLVVKINVQNNSRSSIRRIIVSNMHFESSANRAWGQLVDMDICNAM